ncbi:MAG: glycosyl transferase, partial [Lachnospiraceae bacterium]|nr:glycosyl transferase [Lachnospiraceae bacterium]
MQINTVCGNGSVGKIAVDLKHTLETAGHSCQIIYGRKKAPDGVSAVRIGSDLSMGVHVLDTFFKGEHGFASDKVTQKMLDYINEYQPDLIQLHNIHGFYLNVEML